MTTATYTAEVDYVSEIAMCHCGDCEWRGFAASVRDIGRCVLTPGDESPAGRCPDCGCLVYLVKSEPVVQKVTKVTLTDFEAVAAAAQHLIRSGVWFSIKPLSSNFTICVKAVDAGFLPTHHAGKQLHAVTYTHKELFIR